MTDRAGAIVERPALDGRLRQGRPRRAVFAACQGYAYDPYGLPLVRESAGRGDCDSDTDLDSTDSTRVNAVQAGTKWDARADMDDDGDVDLADISLWTTKSAAWGPPHGLGAPTVAQAFSDIGNPFMFQRVPHMALDTASNATSAVLPLNQHRLRFNDCVTGRWITRDLIEFESGSLNVHEFVGSNPISGLDPLGLELIVGSGPRPIVGPRDVYDLRGQWCAAVKNAIENLKRKIKERKKDLEDNPRGLGWSHPCDLKRPRLSQRGHVWLVIYDTMQLAYWEYQYWLKCKNRNRYRPPSNVVPVPETPPLPTWQCVGIGVGTSGALYGIYRGIRMIPSLIPPLWPTLPANVVCPWQPRF